MDNYNTWLRSFLWHDPGNSLYRGKVPHVQSSTNCGLGCFKTKTKYFFCTNSHFLSGLTTAQAIDPLPLYRDFPAWPVIGLFRNWKIFDVLTQQDKQLNLFCYRPQQRYHFCTKFIYGITFLRQSLLTKNMYLDVTIKVLHFMFKMSML
jgi:hypothetical protein